MKKALSLVLAIVMITSLAGCGDNTNGEDNTQTESNSSVSSDVKSSDIPSSSSSEEEEDTGEDDGEQEDEANKHFGKLGWEYEIINDKLVLTKYIGQGTKVSVENEYIVDGKVYEVVIGESTANSGPFIGNTTITSVVFGETVEFPEDKSYMFSGCTNLTYVQADRLFDNNTTRAVETFYGCPKISTLDMSTLDKSDIRTDSMLSGCNIRLLLVKNNTMKDSIASSSRLPEAAIIAEVMDDSIWDYTFNREKGQLELGKYKGSGKADPASAYSIDGRLYTNVVHGGEQVGGSSSSSSSSSKPSGSSSKPSGSSSKPSGGSSSSSSKPAAKVYYTVTFNSGDGSKVSSQKILSGEVCKEPKEPTNEYYKFYGWYTSSSLRTKYDFDKAVTKDMTLYARWEDASSVYVVEHYKQNGGNPEEYDLADEEVKYTVENTTVTAEAKKYSGYTEDKRHPDREYRGKVTDDGLTLRLYYKKDTFTAKFNSNGGNSINSQTVKNGGKYRELKPVKRDATFDGWYLDNALTELYDFDSEAADITLYAKWKYKNTDYRVEHYREDANGNYRVVDTEKLSGSTDSTVNATEKVYEGYKVNKSHPDSVLSAVLNRADIVLKVYYDISLYTVSFEVSGGTYVDSQVIKHGSTVGSIGVPTKDGFTFDGWYTDSSCLTEFNKSTKITSDLQLFAKWIPDEVKDEQKEGTI